MRVYTRCCVIFYMYKFVCMYVSNTNIRIVFLRHQNVPDMSYVYATVNSKARITTTTNQKITNCYQCVSEKEVFFFYFYFTLDFFGLLCFASLFIAIITSFSLSLCCVVGMFFYTP